MNYKFKKIPMTIPDYEGRLFTENPRIKEFYNFEKNIGIDYRKLTPGSRQLIWLKCPVCGYEFEVTPNKFSGCDFCAGGIIRPGYNDVATLFPELALDFVPELNPEVDLTKEAYSSTKLVRWKCHVCGEEWTTQIYSRILNSKKPVTITKCKKCAVIQKRKEEYPGLFKYLDMSKNTLRDIATCNDLNWLCPEHGPFTRDWYYVAKHYKKNGKLPCCNGVDMHKKKEQKYLSDHPELVEEFSPNNTKKPEDLTERSSYMAKWICKEHGEYIMKVRYRTVEGRGCPACRINGNYFYQHHSELEKMYSKKNTKPFSDVRATDNDLLIWECNKGHEFTKMPYTITKKKENICPACRKLDQYEEFKTKILSLNDNMIDLWDDEKNYQYFITENKPLDDYQKLFGKCENGHEGFWDVRAIARNGGTCPICDNRKIMAGVNDLKTTHPELVEKLIPEIKKIAGDILYKEDKYLECVCPTCEGTYFDSMKNINDGINNCPYCAGKKVLSGYNDLATVHPELVNRLSSDIKDSADKIMYKEDKYLSWICPTCGGEYTDSIGSLVNGINNCPYCAGTKLLIGYNDMYTTHPELVIRLSKQSKEVSKTILYKETRQLEWICPECHGQYYDSAKNIIDGVNNCPYCSGKKVLTGYNDLATVYPELVNRLSSDIKNSADKIVCKEDKYLPWICPTCGGGYTDSIGNLVKGIDNCPYCAGTKLLIGYNDMYRTHPELVVRLSEQSKETAKTILYKETRQLEWVCPDCHGQYYDSIKNIIDEKNNCPYCAGKKVLPGYNDLLTIHPELADRLKPDIKKSADKIMYKEDKYLSWICPACGGEYTDSIGNLVKGIDNCPYCAGKKVLPGYNDVLTKFPSLRNEVYDIGNYAIGTDLDKCLEGSSKPSYWQCQDCGNVYRMKIIDRAEKEERGHRACPRCNLRSKNKVFIF